MYICTQVCIQLKRWLNTHDKILEYIIQVSIRDEACDDNLQSFSKKGVMLSARNGVDASILHLFAICNVVKMPVNSIYPKAATSGVNRDVHNQMLFPLDQIYYPENLDGMISILWIHSSNTDFRGWIPNHLVPCFPDFFHVSSSFALPHTSSTEEKGGGPFHQVNQKRLLNVITVIALQTR